MLRLLKLKLEINTTNGLYGSLISFDNGLNIVRANNTSGKSTLFQSITYALGVEELIGGRYEKTMQSVLKDLVVDDKGSYEVTQSSVYLEISNGKDIITIRRDVVNEKRKSQLIDVIFGARLSANIGTYEVKQMYVHDKGAASDETYGFHKFLEEFIGWDLPDVLDTNGNRSKLYIPLISSAFIIEQKSGWSSFFANLPFYGIRSAEERVVEFILKLDVFKNEQDKIELGIDKKLLSDRWSLLYADFTRLEDRANAELVGLDENPRIINSTSEVYFRILRNQKSYLVSEVIEVLQDELDSISNQDNTTVGENIEKNQDRLQAITDNILRYSIQHDQLEQEAVYEKEKLKQYIQQKKDVQEQLEKNKAANKMTKLGADMKVSVADNICPTCGQAVKDSLLPAEVDQTPLKIEENIQFLSSQLKMIEVVVGSHRKKLIDKETLISDYRNRLATLRQEVRSIKRELVSDDRLPSEELIERKINTKRLIQFYQELNLDIENLVKRLQVLSKEWEKIKNREAKLSGNFFTSSDAEKVKFLEDQFLKLLDKFNYQSKDKDSIKISTEKYLPVIEVKLPNGKAKSYDIRFDSSGSDHIRCMWAYYTALLKTSAKFNGNHPGLLMFDEPQQQSASVKDFHQFLDELSSLGDQQPIVFASFQNSQQDYNSAVRGLKFQLIDSNGKRFVTKQ